MVPLSFGVEKMQNEVPVLVYEAGGLGAAFLLSPWADVSPAKWGYKPRCALGLSAVMGMFQSCVGK